MEKVEFKLKLSSFRIFLLLILLPVYAGCVTELSYVKPDIEPPQEKAVIEKPESPLASEKAVTEKPYMTPPPQKVSEDKPVSESTRITYKK